MDIGGEFDVLVIGGGHAGTEAALAAARLGARTLLLTHNIETIGQMSCNPAIGGIGKGHLVKEIDALGGAMALATDDAGIQWRRLNSRRGAAVQATRAQADRALYKASIRRRVESQENLAVFQQEVDDIIIESGRARGAKTRSGTVVRAKTVVLTAGTFLAGKLHTGEATCAGGRAGDSASVKLATQLREALPTARLKTGTPPRLDGRTIDYSKLEEQPGDEPRTAFSFIGSAQDHPRQVSCHIARTGLRTHEIVRAALHRSPMYNGSIEGTGPRYCPSIEDKIVRFADKESHQIFVEPEGLETSEVYPNGISTCLPLDVQIDMVRSIPGFESVHMTRAGYAVEYDFFDPRRLAPSLESQIVPNLFLAGQINGTTGYEEAAAQGLVAGLNAARAVKGDAPWHPRRDEAYIGVLIDDLTTKGVAEPYRMFTSRAEFRLRLREDNADLRLTEIGLGFGLICERRWRRMCEKRERIEREVARLGKTPAPTGGERLTAAEWLRRPDATYAALAETDAAAITDDAEAAREVETHLKYEGYVARQEKEVERQRELETLKLPNNIDYGAVSGLTAEAREKFSLHRPATVRQAAQIDGITPVAVALLQAHLIRRDRAGEATGDRR